MGRVLAWLTHHSPGPRAATATLIAAALWLGAWTVSYLAIGEGALREVISARVPGDVLRAGPSLAMTILLWNVILGVGSIALGSMFAIGRISLGYLAPWWWALGYGVALGTNSFVLTVPGKLAPRLDVLWQHIGAREILAYVLVAAALANIHVWRPRRWRDLRLPRIQGVSGLRLRASELACIAGALVLLAWTANLEATGVIAFLK
jgi:hypothetical protein